MIKERKAANLQTYWKDKIFFWIAWKLPRRVVYFAYIRLHSYATATEHSDKTPSEVDWNMALNTWEAARETKSE